MDVDRAPLGLLHIVRGRPAGAYQVASNARSGAVPCTVDHSTSSGDHSLALASTRDEYVTRTLTAVVGADNVGASLGRSTSRLRAATLQASSTMFQHGLGGVARPSEHLEAWLNGWRFRLKQGSWDHRHRRKNIFRGCKTLFYHLPGLYLTGPNYEPGHRGM